MFLSFFKDRSRLREKFAHRETMIARFDYLCISLHRLGDRKAYDVIPHPIDLVSYPVIKALFLLPRAADLPRSVFTELVPGWVNIWRCKRERVVLSLLAKDSPEFSRLSNSYTQPDGHTDSPSTSRIVTRSLAPPPQPMMSPMARFFCMTCKMVMSATVALTHWCCYRHVENWQLYCATSPRITGKFPPMDGNLFEGTFLSHFRGTGTWSASCLVPCAAVTQDVLTALGIDLGATHPDTGKARDLRVECTACRTGQTMLVMTWERAVSALKTLPRIRLTISPPDRARLHQASRKSCALVVGVSEQSAESQVGRVCSP